jgi:polar amino acid transport system ATP-binding protein
MNLHIRNLTKQFGDHVVLDTVNLSVQDRGSIVIIGPSGGGKTTLLRVIAGLETPTGGEIEINNHTIVWNDAALRTHRTRIGMVFQSYNLFPHLTALENLTLPLEKVHGYSTRDAREIAIGFLRRFRLEEHSHKKPVQLSGGQKQRIAISRAVSMDPEFVLLDEPTSALDPEFTGEVLDMIAELRTIGKEFIMVTHHMGFARHVADHIVFIADGVIQQSGAPDSLFDHAESPAVKNFFERVLKY